MRNGSCFCPEDGGFFFGPAVSFEKLGNQTKIRTYKFELDPVPVPFAPSLLRYSVFLNQLTSARFRSPKVVPPPGVEGSIPGVTVATSSKRNRSSSCTGGASAFEGAIPVNGHIISYAR